MKETNNEQPDKQLNGFQSILNGNTTEIHRINGFIYPKFAIVIPFDEFSSNNYKLVLLELKNKNRQVAITINPIDHSDRYEIVTEKIGDSTMYKIKTGNISDYTYKILEETIYNEIEKLKSNP